MGEPERLAHCILSAWSKREQLVDLAVTEACDIMDQLIAMARDEERSKRCPGIDDPRCLKIRGAA